MRHAQGLLGSVCPAPGPASQTTAPGSLCGGPGLWSGGRGAARWASAGQPALPGAFGRRRTAGCSWHLGGEPRIRCQPLRRSGPVFLGRTGAETPGKRGLGPGVLPAAGAVAPSLGALNSLAGLQLGRASSALARSWLLVLRPWTQLVPGARSRCVGVMQRVPAAGPLEAF